MWITLAIILCLIVLAVLYVATRPDGFRVSRSATMSAPPSRIFAEVNNFRKWEAWSPWVKMDPDQKLTYDGPEEGEGHYMSWEGNKKVGAGCLTITGSRPDELVRIRMDFRRPVEASHHAEFHFQPEGDVTTVTWTMTGRHDCFLFKAMSCVMSMDRMVGGEFEKGLESIRAIVETGENSRNGKVES